MNIANDIKNKVCLITAELPVSGKLNCQGSGGTGRKNRHHQPKPERTVGAGTWPRATGNDRGEPADLALQSSADRSARNSPEVDHLHVLANLSGALYFEKQHTADGIERMFMVNYPASSLLTQQLLRFESDVVQQEDYGGGGCSSFFRNAKVNFEDIQLINHFSGLQAHSGDVCQGVFYVRTGEASGRKPALRR